MRRLSVLGLLLLGLMLGGSGHASAPTPTAAYNQWCGVGSTNLAASLHQGCFVIGASGVTISDQSYNGAATGSIGFSVGGFSVGAFGQYGLTIGSTSWLATHNIGDAQAALVAIAPSGMNGAVIGSRSSDNNGALTVNNIALTDVCLQDNTALGLPMWCRYTQATRTATAIVGAGGPLYGEESSIQNLGSSAPAADPFNATPTGSIFNLRLDSGIGVSGPNAATAAIDILNNGALYKSGIIFGQTSLDTSGGVAPAIAFGQNHGLVWYSGANARAWTLYSDATSGTNTIELNNLRMAVSTGASFGGTVYVTGTSGPQIYIDNPAGNYKDFGVLTGGATRWQFGGNSTAESGANAGTDFTISNYSDAGAPLGTPLMITRSNGNIVLANSLMVGSTIIGSSSIHSTLATGPQIYIDNAAGNYKDFGVLSGGVTRWQFGGSNAAESGSNVGTDFTIYNYNDAGTLLGTALTISRASETATFGGFVLAPGLIITASMTPTSSSASCTAGRFVWDANYLYVCTGASTWRRAATATW
ncbi:MAG: hypothetical protein JWO51_136 [Rhodospirillales bacterium]|nr:hypothetical protein [Rhodospirillales bacterium]